MLFQPVALLILIPDIVAAFSWDQLPFFRCALSASAYRHDRGGIFDHADCPRDVSEKIAFISPSHARRDLIEKMLALSGTTSFILPFHTGSAYATESDPQSIASQSVYKKVLGKGSYKTVYKVSAGDDSFAMAVEKVSSEADARAALRGIRIAEQLEKKIASKNKHRHYPFERIVTWWFQSTPLVEYARDRPIVMNDTRIKDQIKSKPPTKFEERSYWLVAIKPLYGTDLRRFQQRVPRRYRVGDKRNIKNKISTTAASDMGLDDSGAAAIQLVYEICETGRQMHVAGLVHRDIKPSNILLQDGKPVLIDFGLSRFVSKDKNGDLCIEGPGKIRGTPHYLLASNAAMYKGCTSGDAYAMGKTLYEVIFAARSRGLRQHRTIDSSSSSSASSSSSSSSSSTGESKVEQIQKYNERFQSILANDEAFGKSRFRLSATERNIIRDTIRGLCRAEMPFSFEEATSFLRSMQLESG